jgi:hypothetical protein
VVASWGSVLRFRAAVNCVFSVGVLRERAGPASSRPELQELARQARCHSRKAKDQRVDRPCRTELNWRVLRASGGSRLVWTLFHQAGGERQDKSGPTRSPAVATCTSLRQAVALRSAGFSWVRTCPDAFPACREERPDKSGPTRSPAHKTTRPQDQQRSRGARRACNDRECSATRRRTCPRTRRCVRRWP